MTSSWITTIKRTAATVFTAAAVLGFRVQFAGNIRYDKFEQL